METWALWISRDGSYLLQPETALAAQSVPVLVSVYLPYCQLRQSILHTAWDLPLLFLCWFNTHWNIKVSKDPNLYPTVLHAHHRPVYKTLCPQSLFSSLGHSHFSRTGGSSPWSHSWLPESKPVWPDVSSAHVRKGTKWNQPAPLSLPRNAKVIPSMLDTCLHFVHTPFASSRCRVCYRSLPPRYPAECSELQVWGCLLACLLQMKFYFGYLFVKEKILIYV